MNQVKQRHLVVNNGPFRVRLYRLVCNEREIKRKYKQLKRESKRESSPGKCFSVPDHTLSELWTM